MLLNKISKSFYPIKSINKISKRFSSLIIVENHQNTYNSNLLNTINAAQKLSKDVLCLIIASENAEKISSQVANLEGVHKVFYKNTNCNSKKLLPEQIVPFISEWVNKMPEITSILASSSSFGKSVIPRLAGKLMVAPMTDILEIKDKNTFIRPIYAGNAISTIENNQALKIMTIRPTCFSSINSQNNQVTIEDIGMTFEQNNISEWKNEQLTVSDLPELADAKIVLAGGRAFKSKENFEMLYALAKKMNAAVGASRAAVDSGFCPNDLQIGQTGKVIAPELYIGFGISGAIQHVAGMKDSKIIVAINSEEDNQLFEIADYSLCADLFKVIPDLSNKIA